MAMSDKKTPVAELLAKITEPLHRRGMAMDTLWKWVEFPERLNGAKWRIVQAEKEITATITAWVYEDLIKQLEATEAHKDTGHFDHSGVEFVLNMLKQSEGTQDD